MSNDKGIQPWHVVSSLINGLDWSEDIGILSSEYVERIERCEVCAADVWCVVWGRESPVSSVETLAETQHSPQLAGTLHTPHSLQCGICAGSICSKLRHSSFGYFLFSLDLFLLVLQI